MTDPSEKPRKAVGVYDRPAAADRRRVPWIWVVLIVAAALAAAGWFYWARV